MATLDGYPRRQTERDRISPTDKSAEVTVQPNETVTVTAKKSFADVGTYGIDINGQPPIEVTVTPSVNGNDEPALDPDDDGDFEHVNGDGKVDIGHVQALFATRDDTVVEDNAALFDLNGNGKVDVGDLQILYDQVTES